MSTTGNYDLPDTLVKLSAELNDAREYGSRMQRERDDARAEAADNYSHLAQLVTERDQLSAELAAAKADNERMDAELALTKADLFRAKADTERLDWMEATGQRGHYCGTFRGDVLTRAAIDAARKEDKP